MSKTRHFHRRMSQRGITMDLVDLALQFGIPDQDKIVLGRKELAQLLAATRDLERTAKKALDKGGVIVIEDGETLITTYRFGKYARRRTHAHRRRRHDLRFS